MSDNNYIEARDNSEEIDLIGFIKILIQGKKTIYKSVILFTILGLFLAIFTPKEYSSSTIFIPQGSDSKKVGASFGGLAALAGINIGSGVGESGIPLDLYPKIVTSIPFQKELINNTPLTFKKQNKKISYKEYYEEVYSPGLLEIIKKYTIGLPGLIINKFKNEESKKISEGNLENVYYVSPKQEILFKKINSQLSLNIDKKGGFLTLSVKMPEPVASAELTYKAEELLEKYIIEYKIKKSKEKLNFIQNRYQEKQKIFEEQQQKLASYRDRNRFLSSAQSQSQLTILQSNYNLAFDVLNELAKQKETQQIQVKEDTPIFTIIKPVLVPLESIAPKRLKIIFTWIFLGFVFSIVLIFLTFYYKSIKEKVVI